MASSAMERNYERLGNAFPVTGAAPTGGQGYAPPPQGGFPPPPGSPWTAPAPTTWGPPAVERFTANGVFDKLAGMVLVVAATGVLSALLLPPAIGFVAALLALGVALLGTFKPRTAPIATPIYAVLEGVFLGALSAMYADLGGGIVPMAVLFTGGVFVGCLVAFRTGLVRVTPKFIVMTMVATVGLLVVGLASMFIDIPLLSDSSALGGRGLLFGVIGLVVGVLNLFVDFAFVDEMEERGAAKGGEWFAVLGLLSSLVLVYVNILRILASSRR